jgi:hypothetical protein
VDAVGKSSWKLGGCAANFPRFIWTLAVILGYSNSQIEIGQKEEVEVETMRKQANEKHEEICK